MELKKSVSNLTRITENVYIDETKIIGEGSFGKVFKGFHSGLEKVIAIKFIPAEVIKGREDQFLR